MIPACIAKNAPASSNMAAAAPIFSTVALASLSSGALQHLVGWNAVNLGVVPALVVAATALFWLRQHQRRVASLAVAVN